MNIAHDAVDCSINLERYGGRLPIRTRENGRKLAYRECRQKISKLRLKAGSKGDQSLRK